MLEMGGGQIPILADGHYVPKTDIGGDGQFKFPGVPSARSSGSGESGPPSHKPPQPGQASNTSSTPAAARELEAASSLGRGMACGFCRRRKLRCSGGRPLCANCAKYSKVCEYGPGPSSAKVQAMESRIDELSRQLHQNGPETSIPLPPYVSIYPQSGSSPSIDTNNFSEGMPVFPWNDPGQGGLNGEYDWNAFVSTSNLRLEDYLDFSGADSGLTPQDSLPFGDINSHVCDPSNQGYVNMVPPHQSTTSLPVYQNGADYPLPHADVLYTGTIRPPESTQEVSTHEFRAFPSGPGTTFSRGEVSPRGTLPSIASQRGQFRFDSRQSPATFGSSTGSTPDTFASQPTLSSTADPSMLNDPNLVLPSPAAMLSDKIAHTTHIDPIDGLTEALGEFLFSPTEGAARDVARDSFAKKRKGAAKGRAPSGRIADDGYGSSVVRTMAESDGLTDASRELLIDCFLAHSRLFFEMSIPRFRYRLTFTDRRRPSLALLNAMVGFTVKSSLTKQYLWATRISNSPQMSSMEQTFFTAACRHLDISSANGDRLMDCLRAAMLLSAYSYTSGRFHEGWILAGMAVRLVMSTGLHQIKSCIFRPEPPRNMFLRNKVYLLPPPEDSIELAERIHAFWSVFSIDRCGALATGFPAGLREQDITTPWPRPLADIASGSVTAADDITVLDLYRIGYTPPKHDTPYAQWAKAVTVLERSLKLAFVDSEDSSEYARAWNQYYLAVVTDPSIPQPPAWLDQPKYRCPRDYAETKLGLDQLRTGMGAEGISPVDRKRNAELEGAPVPFISPHNIMLHHQFAAIIMLLHDINSLDTGNEVALSGARKSVILMRILPPLPITDVDSFCVVVWSMIAKVFIKEMHRLCLAGDMEACSAVEEEADTLIAEMHRVGGIMQLSRTQAKAMEELKKQALSPLNNIPGDIFRIPSVY